MSQFDFIKDYIQQFRSDRQTNYQLINALIKENAYLPSNQFCYFIDYQKFTMVHVTDGIQKILGIPPHEFTMEKYFEIIHPGDIDKVKSVAKAVFSWCRGNPYTPLETVLTIEYRIRHADGHFVNVQRQTMFLDISERNNLLASVGIYTVFRSIEADTEVKYSFAGPGTEGFQVPEIDGGKLVRLSKRELEVLGLMAKGMSSKEIGDKLFISKSTVDDHRRNMLKKVGLKNSSELIVLGIRKGVI